MSSKQKHAIAALVLVIGSALATAYAPQLAPSCSAVDPALVEDVLEDDGSDSSSSDGGSSSSG